MKFRISPAAAAVFLAAGLFTSGLRAASAPAAIPFENDAAFNVTLSNTNPSKVVVDGELITSISGPTGAYDQSQTEDGALILSPLVGQNFTLFIQTDHGSSLSLNVRPQPGNGKTLRFTPMSPPLRKNDDAKAWEEGQTYEKTLVALSRAVVNGQVPDDYREYPVSRMPAYSPASDVHLTPERQFVGNHLRVVRFRMSNLRFPDLGIPCPFMLTWTTALEEQTKSQSEAFRKDQDLSKKANSAYAALFPGTKKAAEEWRRTREQLHSNEIALCNTYFNLTLFAPDDNTEAQKCELAAVNVFRKNELEMVTIQYQQMRNWLASFPFVMQEGMWEDLKMTGATLRAKSWNAVSLMPVVAERQLSNVGMPLPTYRNQVAFYDMFGEENGSTNFNIAVTGTSGAGKSFLIQGVLRDVLNADGYGWVIDMGDSYKNYCHQAGGVYLDGSKLRFNPFANVTDIKHSAEGIVRLLTVLASPTQPLDGVCEAILQKAVMDAWEKKANKARIDDVHNYLTNEDVNQAFADKPTIIARLAELAMLLDTYCTWGPDGEYFNADTPTLDGETRFAVLELLSLEDKPKLLSSILFSLILAIQEKMYHSPRDLKKVCIIDEAWRLLGGSNPHAARFIETGYRTVRRHRGAFITITQGIKDFSASKEAEAAWNNSSTKITLLQDAKAFKQYLADNPDQFSDMEKEVIRGFQPALQTGYSSLLINAGEYSSFHRLFVDPVNPIVDYEQIMRLPNLNFYVRLPGEYPVVRLKLKYRPLKKRHAGLLERNIRDALSAGADHQILCR